MSAATEHGGFEKGDLKDTFGWKALGWTARTIVLGGAVFAGTTFVNMMIEYGTIHSEQWVNSPFAGLASEAMKPVADGIQAFGTSEMGETTLKMMEEFFRGVHRLFGIEGTFLEASVAAAPDLDIFSGAAEVTQPALDAGGSVDVSGDDFGDLLDDFDAPENG